MQKQGWLKKNIFRKHWMGRKKAENSIKRAILEKKVKLPAQKVTEGCWANEIAKILNFRKYTN